VYTTTQNGSRHGSKDWEALIITHRCRLGIAATVVLGLCAAEGTVVAIVKHPRTMGSIALPGPVSVRVVGCGSEFAETVRHLLGIELAQRRRQTSVSVIVCCDGSRIGIVVREGISIRPRSVQRRVDGGYLSLSARARLVSLAAAEMVALVDRRTPTPLRSKVRSATRFTASHHRLRLYALARFGLPTSPARADYGAAIALAHDLTTIWGWRVDVAGQYGTRNVELGSASSLALSVAVAATARYEPVRSFRLAGGLGARVGAVRFAGTAHDPETTAEQSFWNVWFGPIATLAADIGPLWRKLYATLLVESGYAAPAATADAGSTRVLSIDGWWFAFGAGLGWQW